MKNLKFILFFAFLAIIMQFTYSEGKNQVGDIQYNLSPPQLVLDVEIVKNNVSTFFFDFNNYSKNIGKFKMNSFTNIHYDIQNKIISTKTHINDLKNKNKINELNFQCLYGSLKFTSFPIVNIDNEKTGDASELLGKMQSFYFSLKLKKEWYGINISYQFTKSNNIILEFYDKTGYKIINITFYQFSIMPFIEFKLFPFFFIGISTGLSWVPFDSYTNYLPKGIWFIEQNVPYLGDYPFINYQISIYSKIKFYKNVSFNILYNYLSFMRSLLFGLEFEIY